MADDELAAGSTVAGYTIVRLLGRGGMGSVYLAQHPQLPRQVALKLLHRSYTADNYIRSRFEHEAEHAARLDHPNIVTVFDRGRIDDQLWIAMKYFDGTDAAKQLASGPLPVPHALHILHETGKALDYAHSCGILHRDVKPANILLAPPQSPADPVRVLLTDFGIAKAADEATHLTQTGMLVATLLYAAPEQLEGKQLDARADIYSLACTFFHLLTGSPPYPGSSAAAIMHGHLNRPIPSISERRPGLPPALDAVMATGLAKNRDHRFSTCRSMADAVHYVVRNAAAETVGTGRPFSNLPPTQARFPPPHHFPSPPPAPPPSQYSPPPSQYSAPIPRQPPRAPAQPPPAPRTPTPRSTAPAKSKAGLLVAVIAVLVLVVGSIAGFLYLNRDSNAPTAEVLSFSGLSGPHGVAIDGSRVLVVDQNNKRVVSLENGQQSELPFSNLSAPSGVAAYQGTVYVADPLAKKVWQLAAGETEPKELAFDGLQEPVDVAVSTRGDIYVSDYVAKTVWVAYAQSDVFEALPLTWLSSPNGIAIDDRMLYIADTGANKIISFDLDSQVQSEVSFTGLVSPIAVAVNLAGDLYVIDSSVDSRVAKLTVATGVQTSLSLEEPTSAQGIAVDSTDGVYVTDSNRDEVVRLPER